MDYISAAQFARKYNISERTARNYCAQGKIKGAFLVGKSWNIPAEAPLPARKNARKHPVSPLLAALRREKEAKIKGGIYHKTQIELTYNSNHIEGSRLTCEQTRHIFETNTIGLSPQETLDLDDLIETANHFHCIDHIIDSAEEPLTENYIRQLHARLKSSTSDSRKSWFAVGRYKQLPNEIGGQPTCPPEEVHRQMSDLLHRYRTIPYPKTLETILDFHVRFERIHPFQDGNGRVGRLILFKECLANHIVPFIITDDLKLYYYRGLQQWGHLDGYLTDTCLTAQDRYKNILDYYRITY